MRGPLALLIVALLVPASGAGGDEKDDKPTLKLRATPKFAFSPVRVRFVAELAGGGDIEEYYCPELQWEWGDGGKSIREPDCEPFEAGTKIQRLFIETHDYPQAGAYRIKVRLKRGDDTFAATEVEIKVRAGAGDPTLDEL